MKSVLNSNGYTIIVEGTTIRTHNTLFAEGDNSKPTTIGVVSILPRVQLALGSNIATFLEALELSRLPLALRKTSENGHFKTHDILRLETGKIHEAIIATISEYNNIVVGLTYNRDILRDIEFRKLVKLSAMHQVKICNKDDNTRLIKAPQCTSLFTGVHRDKLIAIEKARSIRVRVNYKSKLNLPLYYIFSLDKNNAYVLSSIGFDLNDAAQRAKTK